MDRGAWQGFSGVTGVGYNLVTKETENLIVQYLEKHSIQQLAYRGWHRVNRQEDLLAGGGEEVGEGRAEGLKQ